MAGFISQFFRITAGSFKDFNNLFVCVMHGLSRTWVVIKEGGNRFLQIRWVFLDNLLQKRKPFDKTTPPFTDRILPKTYLVRYLHVIKAICSQKDYLCTLYLACWKGSAFGEFRKDGTNGIRYYNRGCNKWHMNRFLVISFNYAIYRDFFLQLYYFKISATM